VRVGAWVLGLSPLALLLWEAGTRGLGSNPIEKVLLHTGYWGLLLLVATLAVTPLRRWTGANALIQARRPLGLFAFFYLTLHVSTYVGLDQFFAWDVIVEDVLERPFITVGALAFLLLVPLAVTSTRGWIRRLGRNWTRLHRLVYPAAILGVVHYQWGVKTEALGPPVVGGVLALLLGFRAFAALRRHRRSAHPAPPGDRGNPVIGRG
jgi:methionine sulfoxide reductase heme-binding subunit